MSFLEISSLGIAYQFVVKIEQKFNQKKKREFGFANQSLQKPDKGGPNPQNKGQRITKLMKTSPSHQLKCVM